MRKSSCVIQGFVIMMLIAVAAYGLGQCGAILPQARESAAEPSSERDPFWKQIERPTQPPEAEAGGAASGKESDNSISALIGRFLRRETATPVLPTRIPLMIEGLIIRDKRPLTMPAVDVQGLATDDRFIYLAVSAPPKQKPMIYKLDQSLYRLSQVRELPGEEGARPGALSRAADCLWLTVRIPNAIDSTMIVQIDPETLAVIKQFSVPAVVYAVVQVADDVLITFDEAGMMVYRWTTDGVLLESVQTGQHVRYRSAEAIGGSIVGVGIDEATRRGVLDVIDPVSLTLIRRHHGDAVADDGSPLLGQPMGLTAERFQFLAGQGENPMLATYILNDLALEDYIPHVERH